MMKIKHNSSVPQILAISLTNLKSKLQYALWHAFRFLFIRDLLLLAIVLVVENSLIYIASAVDLDAQEVPLVDLLRLKLVTHVSLIRAMRYLDSISLISFVTESNNCLLFWICLCVMFYQKGMNLLHKGIRTLLAVRFIRLFTFSITIMPSPRGRQCILSRGFENELEVFSSEWIRNLFVVRMGGGCHDLLFSGHAVIYVLCVLTMWELMGKRWWGIIVTYQVMVVIKILLTIALSHHYTVDIVVAIAITVLAWQIPFTNRVYATQTEVNHKRTEAQPRPRKPYNAYEQDCV